MKKALMILVGGATGLAAGVVAALLLAPGSGSEMRQALREGATGLGSTAQRGLSKGRLRMTELVSTSSDLARQVRDRANDVSATIRDRAGGIGDSLREQAGKARGAIETRQGEATGEVEEKSEQAHKAIDILTQATEALGKAQAALEAIRRVRD